jgi:hypothetical protein
MPDEAFEVYWRMPGGQEIIALHTIFSGMTVSQEQVLKLLGITPEQLRAVLNAAKQLGIVEMESSTVTFYALAPDSSQRGRLDWCLESHAAELPPLIARLRSALLLRFLSTPPAS